MKPIAKTIPLAFNESMSYYECICSITNHINNEIIPALDEDKEMIIELKNYVDDNMLTKDVNDLTYYTKTSDLSTVALTGDYDDLTDKPTIPDVSNFITKDVDDLTYYTKTNDLSTVATTGDYDDLLNKPTIPDISNFITKDVDDLTYYTKTSDLSTVATTGDYDDLLDKPTIPTVPTNISAFNNDSGYITKNVNDLTNYTLSSSLSTVATTGDYDDLLDKPTIPTVPTNISAFNNDSGYITKNVNDLTNYTLSSSLSTVATSGSYNDLSNTPTIPALNNFAWFRTVNNTMTINNTSAYTVEQVPFNAGNIAFLTSDSNMFEKSTNYIKCKFTGKVLIIRNIKTDLSSPIIITDQDGWMNGITTCFSVQDVSTNDTINFKISGGGSYSTINISMCQLIVIRLI